MPKQKIYFDYAATTPTDPRVVKAMQPFWQEKFGNPHSVHQFGQEANAAVEEAREILAKFFNCSSEEVIFTSGGTESNNLAIFSLILKDKPHVITSAIEHPSIRETFKELAKQGYSVTFVKPNSKGIIEAKAVEKAITPETGLVSIMHANNEIGTIQPIDEIAKLCKSKKINFHVDAVQSFTKVPIDVLDLGITAMSFSSHKIHGPKGNGALFMKKGKKIKKMLFGGYQERDLRAGTENLPGIYGFSLAVKQEQPIEQIMKLRDILIDNVLKEIPDTFLNGSRENRLCNNANISFKFIEGEGLLMHLDMKDIYISTGSACSS